MKFVVSVRDSAERELSQLELRLQFCHAECHATASLSASGLTGRASESPANPQFDDSQLVQMGRRNDKRPCLLLFQIDSLGKVLHDQLQLLNKL